MIEIKKDVCIGEECKDRDCVNFCPAEAITVGKDKKAEVDDERCLSCQGCISVCEQNAIVEKEEPASSGCSTCGGCSTDSCSIDYENEDFEKSIKEKVSEPENVFTITNFIILLVFYKIIRWWLK